MRKLITILCLTSFSLASGQEVFTGLKFSTPEQLSGIPLAWTPYSGEELPTAYDISDQIPPAGNQGRQNSCVAWAVAYTVKSYQEKIEENNNYFTERGLNQDAVFSPAFIYNQVNFGEDKGCFFVHAINILSQQGAVKWYQMPYNDTDFVSQPNHYLKKDAKKYRISFWRQVNVKDTKEVKAQISADYPVLIGAEIDSGFANGGARAKGDFLWATKGQGIGGHAMVVVGYDDKKRAFKVINSWGSEWGNNGYCWITYDLFPQVVSEGFVMKDAINNKKDTESYNIIESSKIKLKVTEVQNYFHDKKLGNSVRFNGIVNVPYGIGDNIQIIIKFYYNDGSNGKGTPVKGLSYNFRMPDGTAACVSPLSFVTEHITGEDTFWFISMPYAYLKAPKGNYTEGQYNPQTHRLIAEPILYIDNFAVKAGALMPFSVKL